MKIKMKMAIRLVWFAILGLCTFSALSGCTKEPYALGVMGYNYTDRAIADFSVNGAAGSNVELSTPTSGGGKLSCCVVLARTTRTPFWIDIEYQADALVSYSTKKEIEPEGHYIKVRIKVDGPIPPDPGYLEIHFYPDHHIEAAISGQDGPSPPRLKLDRRLPFIR